MGRWETGARERLQAAAMELFVRDGYDGVTVAQIADTAGLTERTFYRHFADKREVLFSGQEHLETAFLSGLPEHPGDDAMGAAVQALEASDSFFAEERRPWSRARQRVIDAHEPLRERELLKLASLADVLGAALVERGIAPATAELAAQSAMTVFRAAFAAWIAEGETRTFREVQRGVLGELQLVVARGLPR